MSSMLQSFNKFLAILILALAGGQQAVRAFSLGGPIANGGDAWQVPDIGYGLGGDIVAPKKLGEGYRINCQTMYYACDANFLNFFGSNGVVAINQAYDIINTSLTNNSQRTVNGYSSGLTEFPLDSLSYNYQASALGLTDLKSFTLGEMMEQMGLAQPDRWVWTLHDRYLPSGAQCPNYEYLVVQRNFDITASPLNQIQYSPYVNGTLWTYFVFESCPASPPPPLALAVPVQVDPLAGSYTAVADLSLHVGDGGFFSGLTRDDMAGLRYLLNTNNIVYESPTTGSFLLSSTQSGGTSYGPPFPLFTYDLTAFYYAGLTNDPVTLSNLYPGLQILTSSNKYVIQYTTNYYAYYTNLIGAPANTPTLVTGQTVTWALATNYYNTYGNIVTPTNFYKNPYSSNSSYTVSTVQVGQLTGAPAGTLTTNTTTKSLVVKGVPSGDFYINTNACGPDLILGTLFTNVVVTVITNVSVTASNTTTAGLAYSQTTVYRSTNHILLTRRQSARREAAGRQSPTRRACIRASGKSTSSWPATIRFWASISSPLPTPTQ